MNQDQNRPRTSASPADAKGALLALFEAFPADRGEGTLAVGTYLIAIEGYSLPAIEGAVRRIIRGEADGIDMRFLPTPAQLGNLVSYMERLHAPVERPKALPAPGDIRDDSPEGVAHRQAVIDRCRMNRWDWRQIAEGNAPEIDPINPVDDYVAWEARKKEEIARDNAAGKFRLSDEALGLSTPSQSKDRAA